ncbi:putative molybdopterin-guanine dinucleotide biosynthesis protein A [Kitasatospora setae KM-6054]|uniref:Putative molybdopterin-guanine dinucleotide biosynthesis protein A n=1 Tax=Kitasatospora setae (strain ATCC 33774 / DSM 43861 / JCM 3304 / KCC A-0304 / NBRC 14216 / KM-6054) TaxID=452652 RepID=E4MZA0_KITSK|nr:putative molybdopterin-guanine dinucleotide biosynthesis protein A [Kitasatospora setae KM-6054]
MAAAGGAGRRLGGADKPALTVGGRPLLDLVLAACPDARQLLVVGPERRTERAGVRWLREDPPGGGPVAAVAAALPEVTAPRLLLLAADLPFLDVATVRRLLAALDDPARDGALLVDADGRDQPLAAAYRTAALRTALAALGDPAGRPLRALLAGLRLARLPDPADASFDCDTWTDLAEARERAERR